MSDLESEADYESETLEDTQTYSAGSVEDVEDDSLNYGENFSGQNAMTEEQIYSAQYQSVNEDSTVSYVGNGVDEQLYPDQSVEQDINTSYQVDEQLYSAQPVEQDINYQVEEQLYSVQTVEQDISINYLEVNYSSYVEADGQGNLNHGGNAYSESQSAVSGQGNGNYGPGTVYPSQSAGMDGQGNPNYEGSNYVYSSQSAAVEVQGDFGVYGGDRVDGMDAGREQRQEPAQADAANGQTYQQNGNNMGNGPGPGQRPQNPAQSAQQNYGRGSMNAGRGQRPNPNAQGRGRGVNNGGSVGRGQRQSLHSRPSVHWQQDQFNNGRGNGRGNVNGGNGGRGPSRQHEYGGIVNYDIGRPQGPGAVNNQSYQSVHSSYNNGLAFNNSQPSHPNHGTNYNGHGGMGQPEQRYPAQHVHGHEVMKKPKKRQQAQHVNGSPDFNDHNVMKKPEKRYPAQGAAVSGGKLLSKIDLAEVKRQVRVPMPLKAAQQKKMIFLVKNNIVDFVHVSRAEYANRICCYDDEHLLQQEAIKTEHRKSSSISMGKNIGRAPITLGISLTIAAYSARRFHKADLKLRLIQAEMKRRGYKPKELTDIKIQALIVPTCVGLSGLAASFGCCVGFCLGDVISSDAATDLITTAHSVMTDCGADLATNIGITDQEPAQEETLYGQEPAQEETLYGRESAQEETLHGQEPAQEETWYVENGGSQQQSNLTFDSVLNTAQTIQSGAQTIQDFEQLQPNRQRQSASSESSESSSEDERNAPAQASKHNRKHDRKHGYKDDHKRSHKHYHKHKDKHGHKHNQRNEHSYHHNNKQECVLPQNVGTGAKFKARGLPAGGPFVRDACNRESEANLRHQSVPKSPPNSGGQYYGPPPPSPSGMPSRPAPQKKNASDFEGKEHRAAPMQNSMGGRSPMQNEASSYNSVGRQMESNPTGLSHSRSEHLPPSHPQADQIAHSRSVPPKGQLSHIREESASHHAQAHGVPLSQLPSLTAHQAPRVESHAGNVQVRPRIAPPARAQAGSVPVRPRSASPASRRPSSVPSVSASNPAPSPHIPIAPLCAVLSSVPSFKIPMATVYTEPPNLSSNVILPHVTTHREEPSTGQAFSRGEPPSQPPMAIAPLPDSPVATFEFPGEVPNAQSQNRGFPSSHPFRQPAAEPPIVPSTHRRSVPSEAPSALQPNSLPPKASSDASESPKIQSSLPASSASRPSAPRAYTPRVQDGHGPLPSSNTPSEPSNVISGFPSVPSHPPSFPPSAASRQSNAPAYTPRAQRRIPAAAE